MASDHARLASGVGHLPGTTGPGSAHIVFLSMKPTPFIDAAMLANLEAANKMFKAFADGQPRIHYVDVATPMLSSDGRVKPDIFLPDGEHLTPQGYETIWNPIVKKQLSKLYKR